MTQNRMSPPEVPRRLVRIDGDGCSTPVPREVVVGEVKTH